MLMPPPISIIIPALNEESLISGTLDALQRLDGNIETIVVDGGSRDRTREIVSEAARSMVNLRLVRAERGRGLQLNKGARAAQGEVLIFLHADTLLPEDAVHLIEAALRDPAVVGGNFRMVFGGKGLPSKVFSLIDRVRRWFGEYYGDSVIWVRREVFEELGGFIDAPIMEDYDFCRKLERAGRTLCLESPVVSSPRRWSKGRALRAVFTWTLIHWLYLVGVNPRHLAWLYYPQSFSLRNKRGSKKQGEPEKFET